MRSREGRSVDWSNYSWDVTQGTLLPGPNVFLQENVFLDSDGYLHLRVAYDYSLEQWTAAEITNQNALGYGTYEFYVVTTPMFWDPNVVMKMFLFDAGDSSFFNREIDIEISKNGDYEEFISTHFALQDDSVAGNYKEVLTSMESPAKYLITWRRGRIDFQITYPISSPFSANFLRYDTVEYAITDATQLFDSGNSAPMINLWRLSGTQAPFYQRDFEVVLTSFCFTPATIAMSGIVVPFYVPPAPLTDMDLAAAKEGADWMIAICHRAPYASSDNYTVFMREYINPILESHGVDLVLCGHSNTYQRSYLMDGFYGPPEDFNSSFIMDAQTPFYKLQNMTHSGTMYVVAGSSGNLDTAASFDHPAIPAAYNGDRGFLFINVTDLSLEQWFVNTALQEIDPIQIFKVTDIPTTVPTTNTPTVSTTVPTTADSTTQSTTTTTTKKATVSIDSDDGSLVQFYENPTVLITDGASGHVISSVLEFNAILDLVPTILVNGTKVRYIYTIGESEAEMDIEWNPLNETFTSPENETFEVPEFSLKWSFSMSASNPDLPSLKWTIGVDYVEFDLIFEELTDWVHVLKIRDRFSTSAVHILIPIYATIDGDPEPLPPFLSNVPSRGNEISLYWVLPFPFEELFFDPSMSVVVDGSDGTSGGYGSGDDINLLIIIAPSILVPLAIIFFVIFASAMIYGYYRENVRRKNLNRAGKRWAVTESAKTVGKGSYLLPDDENLSDSMEYSL
eukprot:CAMPEP_0174257408 /NCGR_PEP_ID=MMETSP0439-20130205/6544_1 /TAXON_ID=0 /ORGANISM="Stereomyxa ramosa, Strain Chinc5" /LENGTH=735 /DNA_ID=CAMNT_0015340479 /DNA_START=203 /DNA_END=2410 /DNA_ORIENTATION=+